MENSKNCVKAYWNRQSCDTQYGGGEKFSLKYFEDIEAYRYFDQPFVHSFAQFSRYHGKKVLEVGFGAGTDFIQWLRVGAKATGLDLTEEGLDNLKHRIQIYNLPEPESIQVGDAEKLNFPSNTFDLGYSFGVLHHTPKTEQALGELVRVVRPGGEIKIMLYNLDSIWVFSLWLRHALLKGRVFRGRRWVVANYQESIGTKAFSRKEIARMLQDLPLDRIRIRTEATSADYLSGGFFPPLNLLFRVALHAAGVKEPWFKAFYAKGMGTRMASAKIQFSGNPLGFFHCIVARKTESIASFDSNDLSWQSSQFPNSH